MPTYLVTGANRGIGLELVCQLAHLDAQKVSRVFALTWSKSQSLDAAIATSSGRIVAIHCEATNQESVETAVEEVRGKLPDGLDVLINNVGTDLGSQNADLEVETGVRAVIDLVLKSGPDKNGKFLNIHVPGWENAPPPNQYDGKELPW
ncbi:MAG: hypothetical protein Q9216_001300 [Gyalolechia sp. 2 TL-2023]